MPDNLSAIKPPPDLPKSFDWLEFWVLHRAKVILGAVTVLIVAAVAIYWRVSAESRIERAELAFAQAKVFEDYQRVIALYPRTPAAAKALLLLADQNFKQQRYDDALANYREFQSQFPKHSLAEAAAFGIGACLESKGQLSEAIEAYEQMIRSFPRAFLADDARLGIGRCYEVLGRWQEARKTYEDLIVASGQTFGGQPSPTSAEAQERLAFVKRKLRAASPVSAALPQQQSTLTAPPSVGTATPESGATATP
jgi:tetratricopeptide (TPR) repeat protein